jgi:hypothetical protein
MLKPASHKSFAVDAAIASGADCCAVCEHFDGYLCRGEDSPLYKRDVDPMAKCPAFVRQTVAVESIANGEELLADLSIDGIDLDLDEDELNDEIG